MKYILVIPVNHKNLGLFRDLENRSDVQIMVAQQKPVKNSVLKFVKRVHNNYSINRIVKLPLRHLWNQKIRFDLDANENYCMIYLDGALPRLDLNYLKRVFALPNTRNVLVLINSMNASSLMMQEAKPLFGQLAWDGIYTFDPGDVKQYGYLPLGLTYYSRRDPEELLRQYPDERRSDLYFTGGLKGGRDDLILSVFKRLDDAGADAEFHLMVWGEKRMQKKLYKEKIDYFSDMKPYEELLAGILRTKVILEIVQEGQSGPSLRYHEAVCYNRKLLSNNPEIVNFPYYDPRYMRCFSSAEEIDPAWVMEDCEVDYGYRGDFSPVNMLDLVARD